MSKTQELSFIANAALKDIVGRDLITNRNLALIELIKNSKDAESGKVELIFENTNDLNNPNAKIIIRDFGTGMTFEDIRDKWLNIAYSSKKHSKTKTGKAFAGNKGVGRFSCDRLGEKLEMYTISHEKVGYKVNINWKDFEVDNVHTQISDPKIIISEVNMNELSEMFDSEDFISGTCLIISGLRDIWDIKELKNLKKELEKFVITPSSEVGKEKFEVSLYTNFLNASETKEINGKIENKIFEQLNFRTASIAAEIDEFGKEITTSLFHDGKRILTIKEKNIYPELTNIKTKLFYMGRAQRVFFGRKIGYAAHDFGSIFLFLNGFRVYPYGEESNDWLKLDQRKAQGYNRFLGTRELIGYVSIEDSNDKFKPVSAREGLFKNEAFTQLSILELIDAEYKYGFMSKVIRKFEKFVIEGLNWDKLITEEKNQKKLEEKLNEETAEFVDNNARLLNTLSSLVYFGIKKDNFISVDFNIEYFNEMSEREVEACNIFYNEMKDKFDIKTITNIVEINKLIPKINEKIKELEREKQEAEKKAKEAEEKAKEAEEKAAEAEQRADEAETTVEEQRKTIEQIESENLFHKANASQDSKALRNLIHKIVIDVNGIKNKIASYRLKKDKRDLTDMDIQGYMKAIAYATDSILKVAELARSRNYKIKTGKTKVEFVSLVKNYLQLLNETKIFSEINIADFLNDELIINKELKPLNILIMIDNIINNSIKANSKEITFTLYKENGLKLRIIDNGEGLSKDTDKNKIFERGYTTTSGSGLGLSHVSDIVKELGWEINLIENLTKGFGLEVEIK